ncbi:MAG: DUF4097 family beta strand repeat protein [Clostridia bacterium]|nr:DUF4097 family beta strand repeat protein [Clostridia bacterium]
MSKGTKIWLAVGAGLVLAGVIVFAVAIVALGFDFAKLGTGKYETNTYCPEGVFERIVIETEVSDIDFALSDDGKCKVVSREEEKLKHSVEIKDGALVIRNSDERKWFDFIRIFSERQSLTVYLPESGYKSLFIETNTGDIKLGGGFSFERIEISGDTGDVELTEITCKSLDIETDTGDIFLKSVMAEGNLSLDTDTGDVEFYRCDAGSIKADTDTGDISGTLLTEKVFIASSSTGNVRVPSSTKGGRCELSSDTGDIKISIEG